MSDLREMLSALAEQRGPQPCDLCGKLIPPGQRREVAMVAKIIKLTEGCELHPRRIYWCCESCTTMFGEYQPAGVYWDPAALGKSP